MALKEKNGSPKYTKDTKFHGDPSRGCSDILLKTTNDNTMVALEVKINKVKGIHFLGTLNVCKKQVPVTVETLGLEVFRRHAPENWPENRPRTHIGSNPRFIRSMWSRWGRILFNIISNTQVDLRRPAVIRQRWSWSATATAPKLQSASVATGCCQTHMMKN